jgi:hypothetical protein
MLYDAYIGLYAGEGHAAYDRFARDWPLVKKSLLLHGAAVRIPGLCLRAALTIASIAKSPVLAAERVAEARRYTAPAREGDAALRERVRGLAHAMSNNASGDRQGAIAQVRAAEERARKTDTLIYASPIRYRLAQVLGGEEGDRLVAEAGAELSKQGNRNPARWVAMHVPGAWGRG